MVLGLGRQVDFDMGNIGSSRFMLMPVKIDR